MPYEQEVCVQDLRLGVRSRREQQCGLRRSSGGLGVSRLWRREGRLRAGIQLTAGRAEARRKRRAFAIIWLVVMSRMRKAILVLAVALISKSACAFDPVTGFKRVRHY